MPYIIIIDTPEGYAFIRFDALADAQWLFNQLNGQIPVSLQSLV
jgi:hypothetical protein